MTLGVSKTPTLTYQRGRGVSILRDVIYARPVILPGNQAPAEVDKWTFSFGTIIDNPFIERR